MSKLNDMYYNTTNEKGKTLQEYEGKAKTQQQKIMDVMRLGSALNPKFKTSASQFSLGCPITSIRRAVTNLVNQDLLEYTGETRTGMYGRPERLFKLK